MHFTLWPSVRSTSGGHGEIDWPSFLNFLSSPVVATDKLSLEGWSPARFAGNTRRASACELVSCIVLDDDESGFSLAHLQQIWSGIAGAIHTSFSHAPEAPKYRIVLRCSRDMSPDEHARVWAHVRDRAQNIDENTRDCSRLWFVPARREGSPYEWCELSGQPLDVDGILALAPPPAAPAPARQASCLSDARRHAMAVALGSAWPAKGRHEAQLALAGALRAEGWAETEALEFLCTVCRAAGDENRAKREATVRHTWGKPEGAALTGWTRLKSHVDGVLVDAARGALGRDAAWTEAVERRLQEVSAGSMPLPADVGVTTVKAGPFTFLSGGLDAPLPPLVFQLDGLIVKGDVTMLVAHGNSLKTWLAFSLGLSVATGRPWLGRVVSLRGRVAILDFESGDYEVKRRLKILGVNDADVGDRLLRCSYSGVQMEDPETWIALAELRLDMVIIDSFNAATAGDTDENDARAAKLLQYAAKFANATGCTVIVIHHSRKGSGGDDRESVRGSTALFAACDRIFQFTDLEKRDNGIVLSTMHSIKDGAGRRPSDLRVELSDQGLRWVEIEKTDNSKAENANEALVLGHLKANPAGVQKEDLIAVMSGQRNVRFKILADLKLAGVVVEYQQRFGAGKPKCIVMLSPNAPL